MAVIHVKSVSDACRDGDLDRLRRWKLAGKLPDLMSKTRWHWYPHEWAASQGRLDVLKWLVEESGSVVDLTVHQNNAVQLAATNQHFDVVNWLLHNSGQLLAMLALSETHWLLALPEKLRDDLRHAKVVYDFLHEQQLPTEGCQKYVLSTACFRAITAQLVKTTADLEKLLARDSMHHSAQKL